MTDSIHIIENFTNHVPDEFLKESFFSKKIENKLEEYGCKLDGYKYSNIIYKYIN